MYAVIQPGAHLFLQYLVDSGLGPRTNPPPMFGVIEAVSNATAPILSRKLSDHGGRTGCDQKDVRLTSGLSSSWGHCHGTDTECTDQLTAVGS